MVTLDTGRPTTLTYVQERGQAVFRGVVDPTNLEIFRDFLELLPVDQDVVISIAGLDIREPRASSLLVDRVRSLAPGRRLILTGDGSNAAPSGD